MADKHLRLPWKLSLRRLSLWDANGQSVCALPDVVGNWERAGFIVRACNAHDDLVAAARALIVWSNHHLPDCLLCGAVGLASNHLADCPVELARAAIAKAKPQEPLQGELSQ